MTRIKLTSIGRSFAFATILAVGATAGLAEGYPKKPVTIVAAYGPGGASDMATRTIAATAPNYLQQGVLVVNKTGAGGTVGSIYAYKARPDGYTLLLARVATHAVSPAMKNLPYKPMDFTILGLLEKNPFVCATSTKRPYKTLENLLDAIKANPGKLTYGSAGVGTLLQVAAVMLIDEAGIPNAKTAATHVPYKGGGLAALAVLKNEVDFVCTNLSALIGHIQSGKLRALVTTMPKRLKSIPDVPTARELGYPGLEVAVGWSALVGPPNMNAEASKKWIEVLAKLKTDKSWIKLTQKLGSVPNILPPDETKKFIEYSYGKMNALVTKLGMKIK
jgi:tripartite-type tricarboxylate transporter receptor subunit TctC